MPTNPAPVVIAAYDASWPAAFESLRGVLLAAIGGAATSVEHVGSTAVPGLDAKPILDVVIVMPDRSVLPGITNALANLGYVHEGDKGIHEREAFRRSSADVPRCGAPRQWMAHHLYVCTRDNQAFREPLFFRDWLRAHREEVVRYAALKRELAKRFGRDREGYTEAKSAFVRAVLARASVS